MTISRYTGKMTESLECLVSNHMTAMSWVSQTHMPCGWSLHITYFCVCVCCHQHSSAKSCCTVVTAHNTARVVTGQFLNVYLLVTRVWLSGGDPARLTGHSNPVTTATTTTSSLLVMQWHISCESNDFFLFFFFFFLHKTLKPNSLFIFCVTAFWSGFGGLVVCGGGVGVEWDTVVTAWNTARVVIDQFLDSHSRPHQL